MSTVFGEWNTILLLALPLRLSSFFVLCLSSEDRLFYQRVLVSYLEAMVYVRSLGRSLSKMRLHFAGDQQCIVRLVVGVGGGGCCTLQRETPFTEGFT